MKMLKLNHAEALAIQSGKRTTWRLFDDKDLSVNDVVQLVDKVKPGEPETWKIIGVAQVMKITEKQVAELSALELEEQNFSSKKALIDDFSFFYSRKVTPETVVKVVSFNFTQLTDSDNVDSKTTKSLVEANMFADGGSRGNPGPSASGFVILDLDKNIVVKKGTYLGVTTNNQAEYQAVKFGLEEALSLGVRKLHVYLDSLLVVNQMLGKFKVRNRDLWPIHAAIKDLVKRFDSVEFTHVPREMNKLADKAVNDALDEVLHKR